MFVRSVTILTNLQPLEKMKKLKQKTKSKINLNYLIDEQLNAIFLQRRAFEFMSEQIDARYSHLLQYKCLHIIETGFKPRPNN